MTFSKYKTINVFEKLIDIEQEIVFFEKKLFKLRIKKITTNLINIHLFKHFKRKISQLKFKKSLLLKLI